MKNIGVFLVQVVDSINLIEKEVEFFGDNDFLGSPPYPNVDTFSRCWEMIKVAINISCCLFIFIADGPCGKSTTCKAKCRMLRLFC